jgi:NAD(P)-dependent dehydrogenase (short-subunit alcohol dehydrogenase family)
MVDTGLQGKAVLVTGANHGIGAAIASAFAREGADVFVTYRRLFVDDDFGPKAYAAALRQDAGDVVRAIRALGARGEAWEADLADPENIPRLMDRAEAAQALAKTYPLRRVGTQEDIASAVVFFASRQANWVTGQVLCVGGGNRM